MIQNLISRAVLLLLLILLGTPVPAVEDMRFSVKSLSTDNWQARALLLQLGVDNDGGLKLEVTLDELMVGKLQLRGLSLVCSQVRMPASRAVDCEQGKMRLAHTPIGPLQASLTWKYREPDDWQLSLAPLRLPGGRIRVALHQTQNELRVDFDSKGISLEALKPWLPAGWQLTGNLRGKGNLRLVSGQLGELHFNGRLSRLAWSSPDGLQVGEEVELGLELDGESKGGAWQGSLGLGLHQGQLYSDPLFLEVRPDQPLVLKSGFNLEASMAQLQLSRLQLQYAGMLDLQGSLEADLVSGRLLDLDLAFVSDDLAHCYSVFLQPLLIGTPLDDMTLKGRLRGKAGMAAGTLELLTLELRDVGLEQNAGMFGLSGLQLDLTWKRQGKTEFSRLNWGQGHLYQIGFGAVDALFQAQGGNLRLQPLVLPVLGGQLMLHDLELNGLLEGKPAWETRADLDGIQLLELSHSMGWPDLQGSLQASIPRVYYRDAVLRMEGELKLDVFGGEVRVEGLELQEPLGVAPVLQTSLRFTNLDLEQITQVFSFGRIEGSLEGQVRNLQLVGWEVTAFDASLQSPPRDKRRHRISQRAIDNLTELGNGASVQLSATMLRFFEDFAYDSLALKVRLRGTTAELDGVPRPQGGYYIVKGARLPRIDVIGRNHRIAWKELLSRIRDIRFDDMIVE